MIDQFDMHSMMMIQSWPHAANETLKFQNGEAFHNALKIFKEGGGICHALCGCEGADCTQRLVSPSD